MIQLEDQILKYILKHGIAHPKDIRDKFLDTAVAMANLKRYNLIEKAPGKVYSVILTREGVKAQAMGFKQYILYLEAEEEKKKLQVRKERKRFIVELIVAIIGVVLALISIL